MPSISALVDSLSLDLTTNLVAAGIVNPLWDEIVIASATVTTKTHRDVYLGEIVLGK